MRRVILALLSTSAALVMLLSFKSHSVTGFASPPAVVAGSAGTGSATPAPSSGSGSETPTPSSGADSATASPSNGAGSGTATRAVSGDAVDTRWGPVRVQVTLRGSTITAVTVLEAPNGNPRDVEINDYALPVLTNEALAAQNAGIDAVSGATVTSDGYIGSLQSALDRANA